MGTGPQARFKVSLDGHVICVMVVFISRYHHNIYLLKKSNLTISGEDVYKPYDLFSNPDTLFIM